MTLTPSGPSAGKGRVIARLVWRSLEMMIAGVVGMMALPVLWNAVLPEISRFDVAALLMSANMAIGVAVWMLARRYRWPRIAEMGVAVVAPFLVLLVPFWYGVLSAAMVMTLGHAAMFILIGLLVMVRRREYADPRHRLRVRISGRWAGRSAVVLAALALPGAVSAVNTVGKFGDLYRARDDTVTAQPSPRAHDPAKPTVAFVTSAAGTNAADLLAPYEVLTGTGRFNTYVVSTGAAAVPLSGGLDLVPDLTLDQLTSLLDQQDDRLDVALVPALYQRDAGERQAITGWLRQQHSTGVLTVSVCHGARTLAEAGLLDGRTATSHWWRLPALRADFPTVTWTAGRRYVDDGNVISTAGVLSGIDGALRIIERLIDQDTARQAAQTVRWGHYSPGTPAPVPVSTLEWADAVVALNASYQPGPSAIGVQLTEGVGELDLSSIFISYTEEAMVGRTLAIGDGPIRSEHGLTFVPRHTLAAKADDLDRLLVPGRASATPQATSTGPRPEHLHLGDEFAYAPVLRDIATTYDLQTARWTAKTLEYPTADAKGWSGSSWPWPATLVALGLALLGGTAAQIIRLLVRRLRSHAQPSARQPGPLDDFPSGLTPSRP
ncbi:DJ-1/PfpI family protein [Nonomuraea soli]|uniref:Putative intracellular protease/amidase n=1 Tax=Nonomuraea soli TaxID=1032476 RepID=A0A7W0CSQ2_9ACTN|nr:DJ-1/PfpI family protein [Nonomuraea soli]MBA2896631.1 putative intracellular protease/amidase [Nonomuraea soli]